MSLLKVDRVSKSFGAVRAVDEVGNPTILATMTVIAAMADVTGIAPTVLTKRLRQLDADGIVVGRPYSERPLRFSYELTGPGRALAGAIQLLRDWGASHTGDEDAAMHTACGSPLVTRLWCPSCETVVGDDDASENVSL